MRNYRKLILPTALALALVVAGIWGYNEHQEKNEYRLALNNEYQRLFYDVKSHVENVQVNLSKALVADSNERNVLLLSQIMQQAYMAQDKLGQMPIPPSDIRTTEKFLSQVSDYSYALIQDHLEGKPLDQKQRNSLASLRDYTTYLSSELSDLHDNIMRGQLDLNLVRRKENKKLDQVDDNMLNTRLVQLGEQMTEYPELIYDGPFSDQVMRVKPRGLGEGTVTREEAEQIAREFIGEKKARKFTEFESGENGNRQNIDAYTYSVAPENEEKESAMYISVSKTGGNVVWYVNPRAPENISISDKQAEKIALEFLEEQGYENMESNYSLKYDGTILINFVNTQQDVTIYPDLVKVRVALDDGEVVGFDAAAYLQRHHQREDLQPEISQEEARDKVRYDFDISNVRLAVIPKGGLSEVLCYEFRGTYDGEDFIVYINAKTGREEQILQIIRDDNGTLTF